MLVLVRGDDRLSETKLYDALGSDSAPRRTRRSAPRSAPEAARSARSAFEGRGRRGRDAARGPVRRRRESGRLAPPRRRGGARLRAAVRRPPRAASRATVARVCGGALHFQTAIEVGHIFHFGTFYSEPLEATFLDEDGKEKPILGGSYGIGPGRVMAAIVEQHHDEHGIAWPRSVAPYDVHIVALPGLEEQAAELERRLEEQGVGVLLDDRDLRAGEKFADADLIGCPVRITWASKTLEDGAVDVLERATGEERRVPLAEVEIL